MENFLKKESLNYLKMENKINLKLNYLGALKQAPFLIRELKKIIPDLKIDAYTGDYTSSDRIGKDIFLNDLNHEGISSDKIEVFQSSWENRMKSFDVLLNVCEESDGFIPAIEIDFWIDPLKFEKRKLLNKEEINEFKEKYKLGSEKIVLAGSIHLEESKIILNGTKKFLEQKPKSKIIIVPRKDPEDILRVLSNHCQFPFSSSDKANGHSRYLVITELGVLDKLYSICDIAVIGDSFETGNGQNPLEPAFYGKRTISGKSNYNNAEAYNGLSKSGLLKRIYPNSLEEELLKEIPENEMAIYRENAKKFIESKQGAAKVYAECIKQSLEETLTQREFQHKMGDLFQTFKSKFSI